MNSTFALAFLVGICAWSTAGRGVVVATYGATTEPRTCIDLAKQATADIKSKYDLPNINVEIGIDDLCDQIDNIDSTVDFVSAVNLAMESFLTDSTDVESPLALAINLAFEDLDISYTFPVPDHVVKHAQKMLLTELNASTTSVQLLARGDVPEAGESVDANWILLLKANTFSDHSHWAVVDRSGDKKVYNYGFN